MTDDTLLAEMLALPENVANEDDAALAQMLGIDLSQISMPRVVIAESGARRDSKAEMPIATFDFETDPGEPPLLDPVTGRTIAEGLKIAPFAWGFFDGVKYASHYGEEHCAQKFVEFIREIDDPHIIYAHNGGMFDFLFLLPWLEKEMFIINGRIVECRIGRHVLRDSFAIIPVALKAFGDKREIEIDKLKRSVRRKHKAEIMDYMRQDCEGLWKGVNVYRERFGLSLTMASTALKELEKTHGGKGKVIKRLNANLDGFFRQFYYGGRVECFAKGIIKRELRAYDVNSMYPFIMASRKHPVGNSYVESREITDDTDFAIVRAWSKGALPVRTKEGLRFMRDGGVATFAATGHEIREGMRLGVLKIDAVEAAFTCDEHADFAAFVDPLYAMRNEAKARGDKIDTLFLKLVLNSAYGKTALDPNDFCEHWITGPGRDMPEGDGWRAIVMAGDYVVWQRSLAEIAPEKIAKKYINVATAASITGGARSVLLEAIESAASPIYCDTDSVIAESLPVAANDTELGAWKLEAEADQAAIAARKIYALWREEKCIKLACKGARLTPDQIRSVAEGGAVLWQAPVPKLSLDGRQQYVHRVIRAVA